MIIHDHEPGSLDWIRARLGKVTASAADQILTPGKAPYMPQHYALAPGYEMPSSRAKRQREIVGDLSGAEMLDCPAQPLPASSARQALLDAGTIVEVPPPHYAEPIVDPPRLSEQRDGYMDRLLAEWLTGEPCEEFEGNFWTDRGQAHEAEARDWFSIETGLDVETVGFCERADMPVGCSPDGMVCEEGAPIDHGGIGWEHPMIPAAGLELKVPARHTHIGYWRRGELPRRYLMQCQFSLWVTGWERWYFMSYCPEFPLLPMLVTVEPDAVIHRALDEHVPAFVERMMAERQRMLDAGVVPREGVSEIAPPEEEEIREVQRSRLRDSGKRAALAEIAERYAG